MSGREIPILFSAPMVRAILEGRKTQTRRLHKEMNAWIEQDCREVRLHDGQWCHFLKGAELPLERLRMRWGIGDRLWVREQFYIATLYSYGATPGGSEIKPPNLARRVGDPVFYAADGDPPNCANKHYGPQGLCGGSFAAPDPYATWLKHPSIHMPRWASRITLEVTGVKVERLQDISEEDAEAEGVWRHGRLDGEPWPHFSMPSFPEITMGDSAAGVFSQLWEHINGDGSWAANPWVVAISFKPSPSSLQEQGT